jgi:hypothetical protein
MNKENNYLDERTEQILKIISNDEGHISGEGLMPPQIFEITK